MLRVALVALVIGLAGCSRKEAPAPPTATSAASGSATPASAPIDAGNVVLVDLAYVTPTVIAVSSAVDNPKDFPEHLIDYKPDTAWNGKTGDLVGGWIAFRVPADAHVAHVDMTVGFDKVAKDGTDLFTANHRIRKIRIVRDGKPLGDHAFDVEVRKAQRVPIGKVGGEYKLEILETVPGTKKEWRELVVSELHVMGATPHPQPQNGRQPNVFVSTLDPPKKPSPSSTWQQKAFPSIEALCAAQMADSASFLATVEQSKSRRATFAPDLVVKPSCKRSGGNVARKLGGPFLDLASIEYETGDAVSIRYVLRTASGWRLAPALPGFDREHYDPGCPGGYFAERLEAIETVDKPMQLLVLKIDQEENDANDKLHARLLRTCKLKADETLECGSSIEINETRSKHKLRPGTTALIDDYEPWGPDEPYTILPDGTPKLQSKFKSEIRIRGAERLRSYLGIEPDAPDTSDASP